MVVVVVMGVSGAGKTTVARALAGRLGWPLLEGDDLHPAANVARMRAGAPLSDDDRRPWLTLLAAWVGEQEQAGHSAVLACSALRRAHRERLRAGHPSVWCAHLQVPPALLSARVEGRAGHWMAPSLLASQLATLEPLGKDEPGVRLDGQRPVPEVVDALVAALDAQGRR